LECFLNFLQSLTEIINIFLRIATDAIKTVNRPDYVGHYSYSALRPVTHFVERPALHSLIREQLHDTLTDRNESSKILVIHGLGGAGKSQLTLNYVQSYRGDYSATFWIEAGQRESIERDYLQIHTLLFGGRGLSGNEKTPVEKAIAEVKSWFHGRDGKWLFVFDSVDTIDNDEDDSYIDLGVYLPDAASVDVIITTRSSEAKNMTKLQPVEVAELKKEEAAELFRRCSKLAHCLEGEVMNIINELGCLALAISLAGAYIAATPRLRNDIYQYLSEYRERRKEILSQKPKRHIQQYGESVLTTWESSFTAVCKESPGASDLLGLLAFLNPDDILMTFFEMAEQETWQSDLFPDGPLDQYTFEEAFRTLQIYSLVQWRDGPKSYYMHKLVHAWAYDRLYLDEKGKFSVTSLKLLAAVSRLSGLDPTFKIRFVPHIMASFNLSARIEALPSGRRRESLGLLGNCGDFLKSMGQWSTEVQIREFCFKEQNQLSGHEHPDTLISMANLASTYWNQGHWKEAEELDLQVMETRKRVLGQEHLATLVSMANLASTYQNQGRWKEAEELEVQVMETSKRVLGQEHPDTLISMGNLASTYRNQGCWKEAEELEVQVMEMRMRVLGQEHPATLISMGNLASTYRNQGRWKEAEELQVQVMEMMKRVLGKEHPDTLSSMGNLAFTLKSKGQHDEAVALMSQCASLRRLKLGIDHPRTILSHEALIQWQGEETGSDESSVAAEQETASAEEIDS
jgi:tetratricopeptide (TPR) repeat protein